MSPRRPPGGGAVERRVVIEDLALEPLQLRARLDTQLVHERAPRPLIRVQRLRLSARPVEREHQLSAQTLAKRVPRDERLQLGDQVVVPAKRQVGLDPLLYR